MVLRLDTFIAFIIGALVVAVPFAYLMGRMSADGVSEEFIVAASKCRHDVNEIQELLSAGDITKVSLKGKSP